MSLCFFCSWCPRQAGIWEHGGCTMILLTTESGCLFKSLQKEVRTTELSCCSPGGPGGEDEEGGWVTMTPPRTRYHSLVATLSIRTDAQFVNTSWPDQTTASHTLVECQTSMAMSVPSVTTRLGRRHAACWFWLLVAPRFSRQLRPLLAPRLCMSLPLVR